MMNVAGGTYIVAAVRGCQYVSHSVSNARVLSAPLPPLSTRMHGATAAAACQLRSRYARQLHASSSRLARRGPKSSSSSSPDSLEDEKGKEKEKKKLQNPRNDAISYSVVRLVNPQTGALDPPTRLREVLKLVNRKTQYLELVTEKPEPIVKLINVKERYDRTRAKHVQQVLGRAPEEKELQLTWGVGAGDLAFKLRKAREDLNDGDRVTLVFAPKKGQKAGTAPEERDLVVEEALRLLEDVGRERKERTVQNQAVALYLEPLRPKQVHDLKWAYAGDELWKGLKAVTAALRSGVRVDAVFALPPPPKAAMDDPSLAVEPDVVQERLEQTVQQLAEVGREWKPREVRKTSVIVHLESVQST